MIVLQAEALHEGGIGGRVGVEHHGEEGRRRRRPVRCGRGCGRRVEAIAAHELVGVAVLVAAAPDRLDGVVERRSPTEVGGLGERVLLGQDRRDILRVHGLPASGDEEAHRPALVEELEVRAVEEPDGQHLPAPEQDLGRHVYVGDVGQADDELGAGVALGQRHQAGHARRRVDEVLEDVQREHGRQGSVPHDLVEAVRQLRGRRLEVQRADLEPPSIEVREGHRVDVEADVVEAEVAEGLGDVAVAAAQVQHDALAAGPLHQPHRAPRGARLVVLRLVASALNHRPPPRGRRGSRRSLAARAGQSPWRAWMSAMPCVESRLRSSTSRHEPAHASARPSTVRGVPDAVLLVAQEPVPRRVVERDHGGAAGQELERQVRRVLRQGEGDADVDRSGRARPCRGSRGGPGARCPDRGPRAEPRSRR